MKKFIPLLFLVVSLQPSCEKITYNPDNPFRGLNTRVLMHRGSGDHPDYRPNTLQAAAYGLSVLDGIEVDIQMSKDGTLWLEHDNLVYDCYGNEVGCFQDLSDYEIEAVATCDGEERISTVESIFELMKAEYPNSFISLDVKPQYCDINIPNAMEKMAQSILDLVQKYEMERRVLVESRSSAFLDEMSDQNIVGQFVISFGDIDKGLAEAGLSKSRGISLEFGHEELNKEIVDLVHRKGYGLMVWTINEPEDIAAVWNSKPDFIQTDRSDFMDYVIDN